MYIYIHITNYKYIVIYIYYIVLYSYLICCIHTDIYMCALKQHIYTKYTIFAESVRRSSRSDHLLQLLLGLGTCRQQLLQDHGNQTWAALTRQKWAEISQYTTRMVS